MDDVKKLDGVLVHSVNAGDCVNSKGLVIGGFQPNGLPKLNDCDLSEDDKQVLFKPVATF